MLPERLSALKAKTRLLTSLTGQRRQKWGWVKAKTGKASPLPNVETVLLWVIMTVHTPRHGHV